MSHFPFPPPSQLFCVLTPAAPSSRHTQTPAGSANFAEMQIKTSRFMFFITRLTENTNLAAVLPPSEQIFNAARVNILLARPKFIQLDVGTKGRVQQDAFLRDAAKDVGARAERVVGAGKGRA